MEQMGRGRKSHTRYICNTTKLSKAECSYSNSNGNPNQYRYYDNSRWLLTRVAIESMVGIENNDTLDAFTPIVCI